MTTRLEEGGGRHESEGVRGTREMEREGGATVSPRAQSMSTDERVRLRKLDIAIRRTLSRTIQSSMPEDVGRSNRFTGREFRIAFLPTAIRGEGGRVERVSVRVTAGAWPAGHVQVTFQVSDGTIDEEHGDWRGHSGRTVTVETDAMGIAELPAWEPADDGNTVTAGCGGVEAKDNIRWKP